MSHYDLSTQGVESSKTQEVAGTSRDRCGLELTSIIAMMTRQGATYSEVLELLRQADDAKCLSCRVRRDALPQATSTYDLIKAGVQRKKEILNPDYKRDAISDVQLIRPTKEHQVTPTLYERQPGASKQRRPSRK